MAISVCVLSSEEITNNNIPRTNTEKHLESPEFDFFFFNVPVEAVMESAAGLQLPTADFYLSCLPFRMFEQLQRTLKLESSRFISVLAGQSLQSAPSSLLGDIVKEIPKSGIHGLDLLSKTLSGSCGKDNSLLSALVFASAGTMSILVLAEHDLSPAGDLDAGNMRQDSMTVIRDPESLEAVQSLVSFMVDKLDLAKLNGCFRVEFSISNNAASVRDIKVELEPRIFSQFESLDDWMVERIPGGHEALLCLLLTHHQQQVNGLTAKQAIVRAAFDTISTQLASTFDCIAHVAVMRSIAFNNTWEGSVLDVGCGQGVFGGLLALYHQDVDLYGTDMSEGMSQAPQIRQYYNSPIYIGPMEQTLIRSPARDHITCFSVFQYVTPMTFIAAMSQMFLKARKSITFDIPEVPLDYETKLKSIPKLSRPTDHLASLERIGIPLGWELTMHRHCLTYTEPNYEYDVYSRYIRFERKA